MKIFRKKPLAMIIGIIVLLLILLSSQLPSIGAAMILHPFRKPISTSPPATCSSEVFSGEGVDLCGWRAAAHGKRRGSVIYLHGVSDSRVSAAGVIENFRMRGFDVIAYDSRAHGESSGDICTYGFYEKEDLRRVMDSLKPGPIILIGSSLGAAVALQTAAVDDRVSAVVAAETFSDLRTVVTERAPYFFSSHAVASSISLAENKGHFTIDDVSPVKAAAKIHVPTLLIHGADDIETNPDHSRRVFAALNEPKKLILVAEAGHNQSLKGNVWEEINRWIDNVLI
jgi:pimeloyl-ACP methyl ester carboxylesterase